MAADEAGAGKKDQCSIAAERAGTGFLDHVDLARTQRLAIERDGVQAQILLIVVRIKNRLDIQNSFGARFSERLPRKV